MQCRILMNVLAVVVPPWVMVETLAPEVSSVSTVDGEPRDFAGPARSVQRLLAKSPALYDGISTASVLAVIETVRARAEPIEREIRTAAGMYKLIARPVLGPGGLAHAVRFRLGPAAGPVPQPRPAVGAIWDLDTQTLRWPNRGPDTRPVVPEVSTIAELFHVASGFDRHGEVLQLLYHPEPGDKLHVDLDVEQPGGQTTPWRITIRARDDDQTRGAWLLAEEIVPTLTPEALPPSLAQAGLREAHRRAGTYLAVVQVAHTSISHWLTDPAPWIRWDRLCRPIEVFHPEDRALLRAADEQLLAGEYAEITVRTLDRHDASGGYSATTLVLYPYPGYPDCRLAVARLVRVTEGRPVGELGAPAGAGSEEQLCLSPSGRTLRSRPAHRSVPNGGNK